jgi:hypothetical protein
MALDSNRFVNVPSIVPSISANVMQPQVAPNNNNQGGPNYDRSLTNNSIHSVSTHIDSTSISQNNISNEQSIGFNSNLQQHVDTEVPYRPVIDSYLNQSPQQMSNDKICLSEVQSSICEGQLTFTEGSKMIPDSDNFPTNVIDFENKKILIRSDQTESTRGKNIVVDNNAPPRMIKPKIPVVGVSKVNARKRSV